MAARPARKKRNDLTLKQKYELIKEAEKNRTLNVGELAGIYGCGKTQVHLVFKNKAAIIVMKLMLPTISLSISPTEQKVALC